MTLKPTLHMRLLEMKTSNIPLGVVIEGLAKFKADLEAKGIEVSITVEDQWHMGSNIITLKSESEPTQ